MDLLRHAAETLVQMLMESHVESKVGASRHKRSGERHAYCSSYGDSSLDTRLGALQWVDRIRSTLTLRMGSYFPRPLEARDNSEKALVMVVQERRVDGVFTRIVEDVVQVIGLAGVGKRTVSMLSIDIDERVDACLGRPLPGEWLYLWLDAPTYLEQRQGGRVVGVAAIIAVAANIDGKREIVGRHIGPLEAESFWSEFLRGLQRRGLRGTRLIMSGADRELKAAIRRVFATIWQHCRVQWMRGILAYVPKAQARTVAYKPRPKSAKLAVFIDASALDVLSSVDFPSQRQTKIHFTSPIEWLNKESKPKADLVGVFPNEVSTIQLIGVVLLEQSNGWRQQNRYM